MMVNWGTARAIWQKTSRLHRSAWPVAGLLVLIGAFLWLDFRMVQSQSSVEQQIETFAFGREGSATLPLNQHLDLYLVGPKRLADELSELLNELLKANPYVGDIRLRRGPPEPAAGSVLRVQIIEPEVLWLPVYGRAQMEISFAYASDGEVDWMDEDVIRSTGGPFTLRVKGHLKLEDLSYGLMSRPGYDSHLSKYIASELNGALESALSNTPEGS